MRWIMKVLSINLFVSTAARVEKQEYSREEDGWLGSFLHPFLFFY